MISIIKIQALLSPSTKFKIKRKTRPTTNLKGDGCLKTAKHQNPTLKKNPPNKQYANKQTLPQLKTRKNNHARPWTLKFVCVCKVTCNHLE